MYTSTLYLQLKIDKPPAVFATRASHATTHTRATNIGFNGRFCSRMPCMIVVKGMGSMPLSVRASLCSFEWRF
jgi:hypothetical protein